jgi:hypothetical protein
MTSTATPRNSRSTIGRIRERVLTVAAAVVAAVLAWLVAVPIVGIDLLVRPGGGAVQQVGLGSVVTVSLLASLLGWGLLALLERLVPRRALTAWTVVAVVVLMLSLTGPLTAAANAAVAIALVLMHLVVGAVLIMGLRRSTVRGQNSPWSEV